MNRLIAIFISFLLAALASGAEPSRFEQANRLFADGNIARAADIYQEILREEGPSAPVLYNLGNAEQKLGKSGPAILAYERAKLLTPRDPDLRANLALARKSAAVFEEPERFPRVAAFFENLSLNEWSWLAVGSALFLGVLAILRGLMRLPRPWTRNLVRAAAVFSVVSMLLSGTALYLRRGERNRGVVLTEAAVVRLSPFAKAEAVGTVEPGRIVRLLNAKEGYQYVEVPGTELRGWMADEDVGAVSTHGDVRAGRVRSR